MDFVSRLQTVCAIRLIALGQAFGVGHGIIVHTRFSQTHRPEDQAFDGSGKRKATPLLDDKSQKIVGGMLFVQEFRARLKQERHSLNLADQANRCLMMLKYIAIIGQSIDVRQPGALSEEITNGDLVRSRNSGNETAYVVIQL